VNWIVNNLPLIWQLTLEHLVTALPPILLSFIISIPIGWVANRFRWSRGVLLTVCALLYAIPSFPLFVVLPIIIGTGLRDSINVVIGLTIYGIALMARSTADGLSSVDPDIRLSATAMGFSGWTRFWRVELPLAGPVLLAGIRVVAVSTISLTTVGAVFSGAESISSFDVSVTYLPNTWVGSTYPMRSMMAEHETFAIVTVNFFGFAGSIATPGIVVAVPSE
jgi:osmoprotectant transport system permease protein